MLQELDACSVVRYFWSLSFQNCNNVNVGDTSEPWHENKRDKREQDKSFDYL